MQLPLYVDFKWPLSARHSHRPSHYKFHHQCHYFHHHHRQQQQQQQYAESKVHGIVIAVPRCIAMIYCVCKLYLSPYVCRNWCLQRKLNELPSIKDRGQTDYSTILAVSITIILNIDLHLWPWSSIPAEPWSWLYPCKKKPRSKVCWPSHGRRSRGIVKFSLISDNILETVNETHLSVHITHLSA